ncbi:MAG TPA: DUF1003 domain-containing protein [Ktedonobacteraceae bacterium]|jgi:uncharacterized membrane protein|nr:DUF1003 domain-containing protein [Ktedonobacteraceae bacterium]
MDTSINSSATPAQHTHTHTDAFKHWFGGVHFQFPRYKHDHPPVINVNEVADERLTMGQRIADKVAEKMGSWSFIISQATIMVVWITLNLVGWFYHWDIYPFVLLNLAMSAQAAFATPLIMMSQNRQAEKDRLTAQNDYITDCKGEEEIRHIMEHLDHQDTLILQIVKRLEEQHTDILSHFSQLDPKLAERLGLDAVKVSQEVLDEEGETGGNS